MFTTPFLDLPPLQGAAGTVALPGSKSISNRVLLLSALSAGRTVVHDVLDSDDTRVMLTALAALGCGIARDGSTVTITGLDGQLPTGSQAELFMGNAGTAIRPLTAVLAVLGGDFTRIAAADPRMWRDIFLANRQELLGQLRAHQQALAQFEQQIVAGDGAALEQLIAQASGIRAAWHMDSFKPGT